MTKVVVDTSRPSARHPGPARLADQRGRRRRLQVRRRAPRRRTGGHPAGRGHADAGRRGRVEPLAADVGDRPRSARVGERDQRPAGSSRRPAPRCGRRSAARPARRRRVGVGGRGTGGAGLLAGVEEVAAGPRPGWPPATRTSSPTRVRVTLVTAVRGARSSAAATGSTSVIPTPTTSSAVERPVSCQSRPKPTEAPKRLRATTVWAAAIPLARLAAGTSRLASAASTPSVAA